MMPTPMDQERLKSSAKKNAPKSIGTPQVKSAETCKLFNAGVSGNPKTAKSADPTCYDVVTVDQDRMETNMKPLWKKGDVVNIYQMSASKGLLLEGRATVVKPFGDGSDEHYMVRFHQKNGKIEGQAYERFIDRDGQTGDPQDYIKTFNARIGYAA